MPRDAAAEIVRRLREAGHEAFWVGGCVRDLIRGAAPEDYDIVTSARPEDVRGLFPRTIPVGERFGICLVVEGGAPYEVATFRTEADYDDGRRPSRIAFATAEEDVRRRDFTINGLLMDPETGRIIDHVGGLRDIEQRIIRTIGDPEERFAEDHLRMLRAVRFAATLGFSIEPMTFAAVRRRAGASTVLLSAESMYLGRFPATARPEPGAADLSRHEAFVARLRALFAEDPPAIRLILRRRDSFAVSLYHQIIQSDGYSAPFDTFL
ncbi:MAG: hypothetical protein AAB299_09915, partial [Thermodesulfobacteriota bacterium]